MENLRAEEQLNILLQSSKILLVQFGAVTCTPCAAIHQKLEEWLPAHPMVSGIYVSIEKFRELTAQLGIFTVPTIFVYVEGRLAVRSSGYFSLEDILDQIDRYEEFLHPVVREEELSL